MGFMVGFPDGTFRPNLNLTRVQAVVALVNGLGLTGGVLDSLNVFTDRAQIPGYATAEVATATQRRIVVNYPNVLQLQPMRDITRAEVVALIYQALVALNRTPRSPLPTSSRLTHPLSPLQISRGIGLQTLSWVLRIKT